MKPYEIHLSDWARIFAGDVPPIFYLEIVIRVFFIYLLLMTSMRLLGKRMATKISRLELITMVALASAIGVPMLDPSRGLVPAIIICFVVVGLSRLIARIGFNNTKFERLSQGDISTLIEDGEMKIDAMRQTQITRERLFAHLRSEQFMHLGALKRVYLEPNGSFSIVPQREPVPGLGILPQSDPDFVSRKLTYHKELVCGNCGHRSATDKTPDHNIKCKKCGSSSWTKSVTAK